MIVQHKHPLARHWPWLLAAAIGVGGGIAWWMHEEQAARGGEGRAGTQAANGHTGGLWPTPGVGAGSGGDGKVLIPRDPVGDTRPADINQADWDALNKALEHEPNKTQERQRLVSYLRFQRAAAQWGEMRDSADVAARQSLGREIVDQLPQHVANGEVNGGEALVLLSAIGQDLEPDPARQKAWLDNQRARLESTQSAAQSKALADEQRKNEEFARLQAEVVAKWQNNPPGDRDPATLESQLQALREKVYGGQ